MTIPCLQGSHPKAVLADKAYHSQEFQNAIEKIKAIPVIPFRKNSLCPRNIDQHLYKERHLIECFFGKIKHFRRIFKTTVFISSVTLRQTLLAVLRRAARVLVRTEGGVHVIRTVAQKFTPDDAVMSAHLKPYRTVRYAAFLQTVDPASFFI